MKQLKRKLSVFQNSLTVSLKTFDLASNLREHADVFSAIELFACLCKHAIHSLSKQSSTYNLAGTTTLPASYTNACFGCVLLNRLSAV